MTQTDPLPIKHNRSQREPTPFSPRRSAVAFILATLFSLLAFWHVWLDMIRVAIRDDTFSYALAVPPLAVWLAWRRLKRVDDPRARRPWVGLIMIAVGLTTHALSINTSGGWLTWLWYGSVVLILLGSLVSVLGTTVIRPLLPVFMLLVLVVPVPLGIVSIIGHQLMYLSATLTSDLLRLFGVPTEQYLNLLVVDGTPVNVVQACAGLRSFFAIFGCTAVVCVACRLRFGVAVLMLGLTPALAIVANLVRLVPAAVLYRYAPHATAEASHDLLGFIAIGLVVALAASLLRSLKWAGVRLQSDASSPESLYEDQYILENTSSRPAWIHLLGACAVVLLIGTSLGLFELPNADRQRYHEAVKRQVMVADLSLPGWEKREQQLDGWAESLLKPNASRRISLTDPATGHTVHASLIHCRFQRDLGYHTPPSCYPHAGWTLQNQSTVMLRAAGGEVPATQYTFRRLVQGKLTQIHVVNLIVLPEGRFAAGPGDAFGGSIEQGRKDPWGVAQLSLVFDQTTEADWRHDVAERIVNRCEPTLHMVMQRDPSAIHQPQATLTHEKTIHP